MRGPGPAVAGVLLAALLAAPVSAQQLAIELKVGGAVGSYTESGAGLELLPGPAFGAMAEARLAGSVAAYLGVSRSSYGCADGFCAGRDVSFTSQGLVAGARWMPGRLWARAGLAVQTLRIRSDLETETGDAGVGWDLGAGVDVPLGRGVRLRPAVTYLRHGAAMEAGDGHAAVLGLEVGVAVAL